jgi:hypothetical protein
VDTEDPLQQSPIGPCPYDETDYRKAQAGTGHFCKFVVLFLFASFEKKKNSMADDQFKVRYYTPKPMSEQQWIRFNKDVDLIIEASGCTRPRAISLLRKHDNDVDRVLPMFPTEKTTTTVELKK